MAENSSAGTSPENRSAHNRRALTSKSDGGTAVKKAQHAVLGACLALPFLCAAGSASAAPPQNGHYIYVPPGATVVVLPGPVAAAAPVDAVTAPMAFPVASLIAQQQAMMQRMIADMNAMFAAPMPGPRQLIQAAMRGTPPMWAGTAGPGSGVILTSVGSGNGVCSETITYGYPANGGKPQVHVTRSGNACGGAFAATGPGHAVQSPAVQHAVPVTPAGAPPRLWTAGDPPRPIQPGDPRT
jgi:hypothetical protein